MRFTVPFLLAIVVFTITVLGANQTSLSLNPGSGYDIVSASEAIAFRLERTLGLADRLALLIGALLLTFPALLAFHFFRLGFGGSFHAINQDGMHRAERFAAGSQLAFQTLPASHSMTEMEPPVRPCLPDQ